MTRPPWPSIVSVALLVVLAWPVVAGAGETLQLSVPPFDVPVSGAVPTTASLMAESVPDASDGAAPAMWRVEEPLSALRLAAMQDPGRGGAAPPTAAEQEQHWSRLPFLGEAARARGYTLPLPFGVTAAYNYIGRDIEITDVRVGVNGAPLQSVTHVANRAGWNGMVGPVPLRLWGGVAYWSTRNTARATVDVPDVGAVSFEADQGPKHPWNAVVGVSAVLHRRFELFAEYGFGPTDVAFLAGGLSFRF